MSITAYGTCRYCKQRLLINIPEGEVPEDYEDDIATEECNCAEAREMADRKKSQADAYEKISKLFNNYACKDILVTAVHPLICDDIESISIKVGKNMKATMKKTSKGKIRVEKIVTSGEAEEI